MDYKVDAETASDDFDRFAEAFDLDLDLDAMSEEDRKSFENARGPIVRSIRLGRLTVNEDGLPVYTPQFSGSDSGELTFGVPDGATLLAWDKLKDTQSVAKLFRYIAGMTKQDPKVFATMDERDLKVCRGIALLFLGS